MTCPPKSKNSAYMTIGEVAQKAGVRTSTLRYYESIGLLPAPARNGANRCYEATVLQRLAIIQTAQQAGFTLAEMRILFTDILDSRTSGSKWHDLIGHKLEELNVMLQNVLQMKKLLEAMMMCDDPELAECIYLTGQKYNIGKH